MGPDGESQAKKFRFDVIRSDKPLCILVQRCGLVKALFSQDEGRGRMWVGVEELKWKRPVVTGLMGDVG